MRYSFKPASTSLAVLGTAVASALALALVLSSAPLLGQQGESALAAAPRCSGDDGGGGSPSPSPTATSTRPPGPLPTLPLPTGSASPSPTGSASPTGSPSPSEPPEQAPAMTTPTGSPSGSPSESPVNPPPDSTTRCESQITIEYNGNRQRFTGQVKSGKQICERGRRVFLKRDRDEGRDPTVATTVTNREGRYRIPLPDRNGRRFYAKTPRQMVTTAGGQDIVCKGDRSRSVSTRNPL